MNEMVERVALALCACFVDVDPDKPMLFKGADPDVIYMNDPLWKALLPMAMSAISAMREPSPAMLAAADAATPPGFHWGIRDGDLHSGRVIYKAMIDEALSGE